MRTRTRAAIALSLGVLMPACLPSKADVSLNALISDNMVLQRETETPVWGTALPGERVTVTIGEQEKTTTADENGRWMVRLDPLDAGGPYQMTVSGKNEVTVENIVVGEVWVCSGQSNMAWPLSRAVDGERLVAEADDPELRLLGVARVAAAEAAEEVEGSWAPSTPETVGAFSAVGYFFGRELRRELGVPIGLIGSNWGGTPAEAWTSGEMLEGDRRLHPILDAWETYVTERYPVLLKRYEEALPEWKKQAQEARARGEEPPRPPRRPAGPMSHRAPAKLYNGMIAPLIPYAIRGAIWYQGEANAGRAYEYRTLFPAMITSWREAWGQGDFPFLWVQLPNFRPIRDEPGGSAWAELREAQALTLRLPNTGMACTIEHGLAGDIHPPNKLPVGKRLALVALAKVYGRDILCSGPRYDSMTVEGNKVRLHFDHVGSRLARKVTRNAPYPTALSGFAIAGKDRKFVWASATLQRDTVLVWSDAVRRPVAVRYAWADNPVCNLFSYDGLPVWPFRTDRWPGITWPK